MNKSYFRWLCKSRRIGLIFAALVYMVMIFAPFINPSLNGTDFGNHFQKSILIGSILSVLLAVIITMMTFAFIHRKRSVDLYFSLPVTRRQQLITGCFFSWIVPSALFVIGSLLLWLAARSVSIGFLLAMQVWMIFSLMAVVLFTALVNAFANNQPDAFVMVCAWAVLPLAAAMLITTCSMVLVAGDGIGMTDPGILLSPAAMSVFNAYTFTDNRPFAWSYGIAEAIFILVSVYGLKKEFIERKSERAEQISDDFFAYPLIINLYAVIVLMIFAAYSINGGFMNDGMLVWYMILTAVYIIASFIYRRSFRIGWKFVLVYGLEIVLTLVLAEAGWETRGFGLADRSLPQNMVLNYFYNAEVNPENLGRSSDGDSVSVTFDITILNENREVRDILEKYRKKQVDCFYEQTVTENAASLNISALHFINETPPAESWHYDAFTLISEEDLKKIDSAFPQSVMVYTYDSDAGGNSLTLNEYLAERK